MRQCQEDPQSKIGELGAQKRPYHFHCPNDTAKAINRLIFEVSDNLLQFVANT